LSYKVLLRNWPNILGGLALILGFFLDQVCSSLLCYNLAFYLKVFFTFYLAFWLFPMTLLYLIFKVCFSKPTIYQQLRVHLVNLFALVTLISTLYNFPFGIGELLIENQTGGPIQALQIHITDTNGVLFPQYYNRTFELSGIHNYQTKQIRFPPGTLQLSYVEQNHQKRCYVFEWPVCGVDENDKLILQKGGRLSSFAPDCVVESKDIWRKRHYVARPCDLQKSFTVENLYQSPLELYRQKNLSELKGTD
jgi:hypothetical protein